MLISKDEKIRRCVEDLCKQGWRVERAGNHPKIVAPDGWKFAIPCTPSDHRAALNWISQLRRKMWGEER